MNVFNPAAAGLLIMGLLSVGSSWWAASSINIGGTAVSLALVLVVAAYESRRLMLAFSFVAASILLSVMSSAQLTAGSLAVGMIGVNYFFAFLMLTEPKTSPPRSTAQIVYGVYVAVIYFALTAELPPSLYLGAILAFIALLLGNLTYAVYRKAGGVGGISGLLLHAQAGYAGHDPASST